MDLPKFDLQAFRTRLLCIMGYRLFVKWHVNNRSSVQKISKEQLFWLCVVSLDPINSYPSLHGEFLLRMYCKQAGVDNHTGSFADLMDFCYQSYRCAPLSVGWYLLITQTLKCKILKIIRVCLYLCLEHQRTCVFKLSLPGTSGCLSLDGGRA